MKKVLSLLMAGAALLLSFAWTQSVSAQSGGVACDSASAAWNQGLTPRFSCQNISNTAANRKIYTFISSGYSCPSAKPYCVRKADCEQAYGSEGYQCININEPKWRGVSLVKKPFHCPGGNNMVCAKVKPPTGTEPTDPALDPDLSQTATTTATGTSPLDDTNPGQGGENITFTLSGCCQQIVPPLDHTTQNYSLNHVVQLGINIYKCILCVVGSLMIAMIVAGGVMMMLAQGEKNGINNAKKIISAAIIGGIIVVSSVLIVSFVVRVLGGSFADQGKLEIQSNR